MLTPALAALLLAQAVPSPAPVLRFTSGLKTPESALYDPGTDTYLVSNVSGGPLDKDDTGFIAELSPDGGVVNARLVAGGKGGVTLHAPKGLALWNGLLAVADIDTVRFFERKSGAPKGEVKVVGASFVNDLAVGPGGRLFVTDTGLRASKGAMGPSGSDGVYALEPGKTPVLKTWLKSKDLHHPNGVFAWKDGLVVVAFGSAELFLLDAAGARVGAPVTLPQGSLDGVVAFEGALFVSSWDGACVYRGPPGGPFVEVITGVSAPADLGLDTRRGRLLVPRFEDDALDVYELSSFPGAAGLRAAGGPDGGVRPGLDAGVGVP